MYEGEGEEGKLNQSHHHLARIHLVVEVLGGQEEGGVRQRLWQDQLASYHHGSFAGLPHGQLGIEEHQLPHQPKNGGGDISASGVHADINVVHNGWINGGRSRKNEGWRDALARGLAK